MQGKLIRRNANFKLDNHFTKGTNVKNKTHPYYGFILVGDNQLDCLLCNRCD